MPGSLSDGQIVAVAVQTSPDGLVALALTLSGPAPFESRRSIENDPLGACVLRVVETASLSLRLSLTAHATPLTF